MPPLNWLDFMLSGESAKYLFKDYNLFLYFIENSLVRITDKEGKELNFVIKDVQWFFNI